MDPRRPPEHNLELTADRSSVKDVVKGILHTIFFHRFFQPIYPATHDVLSLSLPLVTDAAVTHLVDTRTTALLRALNASGVSTAFPYPSHNAGSAPAHVTLVVQFLEKKRRKTGWFASKADEHTVWENWVIDLTVLADGSGGGGGGGSKDMTARTVERSLAKAVLRVVLVANRDRDQIPPITTTNDDNPFPCQILINPVPGEKGDGWSGKMGIF